jgi:hypothetical protein
MAQFIVLASSTIVSSSLGAADEPIGLYFLEDTRTLEEALSSPIEKLPLAGKPWIGKAHVSGYDISSHSILLAGGVRHEDVRPPTRGKPFVLLAGGERLYVGAVWSPFSSSLPPAGVPVINTPAFGAPPGVLLIELPRIIRHGKKEPADPRDDPRLRKSLEAAGLLRKGMDLTLEAVEVLEGRKSMKYVYTIRNEEDSPLHVIDPDKAGPRLFQHWTGGVALLADGWKSIVATPREEVRAPEKFDPGWMSILGKGESMRRTVILEGFPEIRPGSYEASFTFRTPPLRGVEPPKSSEGRIWKGQRESRLRVQVP